MTVEFAAAKVHRTCALIKADMEADVARFEGQPLTAPNVSEMFGNLAAAVSALAGICDVLAEASA